MLEIKRYPILVLVIGMTVVLFHEHREQFSKKQVQYGSWYVGFQISVGYPRGNLQRDAEYSDLEGVRENKLRDIQRW